MIIMQHAAPEPDAPAARTPPTCASAASPAPAAHRGVRPTPAPVRGGTRGATGWCVPSPRLPPPSPSCAHHAVVQARHTGRAAHVPLPTMIAGCSMCIPALDGGVPGPSHLAFPLGGIRAGRARYLPCLPRAAHMVRITS
jgi:hypothetical protein